ncbi:MAG: O-antigen ligase family protein [Solirubrobacterales bacterium]
MSNLLAGAGLLAAAVSAAAAILLPAGRGRSAAMLVALLLFPALIAGDQWHSAQIVDLRHNSARLLALAAAALAITAILAAAFARWRLLLPLAIVAALPFRVPLHAGGDTANLLVPLYLVIAAAVLSTALRDWRAGGPAAAPDAASTGGTAAAGGSRAAVWLPRALAAVVVLYALQALYSVDFSKSIQSICFFFVPFSLVYALLRDVRWTRKLLLLVLLLLALEAVSFVLVGSVEYFSRHLFWNAQVIRSNEFHVYFRVNSIFWDPNIYGRYLALVIVVAMTVLLGVRERRAFALLTALVVILWLGLAPTFSQSSFIALLAGLAVLAALRWSRRWALRAVVVVAVLAALVVVVAGGKVSLSRLNPDTSGRANLVSGGIHLFSQRPIWGYGSASFPLAYREHAATHRAPVSVSHTEPVTVAAEQGVLGLAAYAALVVTALWTMAAGLRPARDTRTIARAAVLATFVALLVHTMAYAGFFEDPITWVLLAMGASLAVAPAAAAPHRLAEAVDSPAATPG